MAEPVIVPVKLEVTDIDTSGVNFVDAEKEISKSMSTLKKSINDAFKGIDPSAINKPIEKSMTAVKKSVQTAEDAYLRYEESLIRAGKSTQEYKSAIAESNAAIRSQEDLISQLSQMGPAAAPHLEVARKELDGLIEARNKINPLDFVDKAEPIQLEKVANSLKKFVTAFDNVNKASEEFNQTVQDNKLTDDYAKMLKQAEAYKKKLEELDKKSKKMETLGATDKQWETMRYDTEQVSTEMDNLIKKMREAVTTGKAFRFGEGNKGELSRQINSLAMSVGNRAGNIKNRAKSNQSPYTEDYQKSLNELDKLEKKVEAIKEKSAKMVELGASKKQFENLTYDAEQLDVKIDEVKNHLMGMVNEGGAFKFGAGNADAEISKLRDKSNALQSSLASISMVSKQAQGGLTALGATHPKLAAVLTVANKIATGFANVMVVAGKVASVIAKGFVGAIKVLGKVASVVGKVASGFINLGKRIFSGIKNMNLFGKSGKKTTTDMNTRIKKLGKNILMWGLGFRTAYYAIKRLRTIFVESFKVMGDQFDEVGQPLMRMMESFNRLKGSLATAFQPLVSVVMPILTRFMDYLSGVLEGIGKFMAALTGQGHIYKAVAKDINSVADAAGNANDKLGSYDKLEVISKDNNNTGVDYEMQEIGAKDAASNFANMVKEAWEKANFTSVGVYVTGQLLAVLDKVEKSILPKVNGFVNRVLKSINTFFDGFDALAIGDKVGSLVNTLVNGIEWEQVGMLFANLNNLVWEFLAGLSNGINWTAAGQALADGIRGMFSTLNLEAWVGMMSGFTNGITQAFLTVLTNVSWSEISVKLGTTVNSLFTSIDIATIGTTIHTLFETLWAFVGDFFATVDFEMIASKIATGINNIFNGGSSSFNSAMPNVANGFVTFFTTAISTIDWANIANTLLNGVQTVLQSLSDAMRSSDNPIISAFGEIVGAINEVITALRPALEALINAFGPIIQSILPVISKLLPPIAEILAKAVELVLPVLVGLFEAIMPILGKLMEIILPIALDLLTSLQPIFDVLVNTVLPVIVKLLDALMPLIEGVLGLVTDILAPIIELIAPLLEIVFKILDPVITILKPILDILGVFCGLIGDLLRPILEAITPILEAVSEVFDILNPIISVLVTPLNALAGVFKTVASIAKGILVPAIEIIKTVIAALMDVVKSIAKVFNTAFSSIQTVIEKVGNAIKKPINAVLSGVEKVANGVISAINGMIKALNKLSFDVPDWVPGIGGQKFGFNLKTIGSISIPKLAQGAVIPPNKEFLAMLGDQRHGTNIEAPLDTIKQALAEVMAEIGGANREPIVLQVNGRALAKVVWDEQEKRYKQTGRYSMA